MNLFILRLPIIFIVMITYFTGVFFGFLAGYDVREEQEMLYNDRNKRK